MKKKHFYIFTIMVMIVAALCLSFCGRQEKFDSVEETNDGIKKGDLLVAAVEAFHKKMGRYPTDLDELVPEYVSEIPETIAGKEFTFEENDGDIFYVSFPVTTKTTSKMKVTCSYMKSLEFWDCSTYIQ